MFYQKRIPRVNSVPRGSKLREHLKPRNPAGNKSALRGHTQPHPNALAVKPLEMPLTSPGVPVPLSLHWLRVMSSKLSAMAQVQGRQD